MGINLGDRVPNFKADSSQGEIDFYSYIEGSWAILFSHPDDFTPVCTTELASLGALLPEFEKRGVKVLAVSYNTVESHKAWIPDIESYMPGSKVGYPILADPSQELAVAWGMVDPTEKDASGTPLTARAVFVIGPDKKLKLSILYPVTTGRSFSEVLRVLDSLQLAANHRVATPADWQHGDKVMVWPTLSDDAAAAIFPKGVETVPVPSVVDASESRLELVESSPTPLSFPFLQTSVLFACRLLLRSHLTTAFFPCHQCYSCCSWSCKGLR